MTDWLNSIPLIWGKIIAVAGFLGMMIWTWFRPHGFIFRGAPDHKRWRDLRIWTMVLLGIQVIIYLIF